MTKTKLPVKVLPQKEAQTLLGLMIDLSPWELLRSEEDVAMLFGRAHAAHNKADKEAHRIWRRTVKNVA